MTMARLAIFLERIDLATKNAKSTKLKDRKIIF